MPDYSASGDKGTVTQYHRSEVDGAYLLYTAVQSGHNSLCAASADNWPAVFRDGTALSQHLYAGHDFPCDHLRTDSDGRRSEEAAVVRKWTVSPCALPDNFHGKLYSGGKSCRKKSDLAACNNHAGLWPGHAVSELGEKSGRAISVFPDS